MSVTAGQALQAAAGSGRATGFDIALVLAGWELAARAPTDSLVLAETRAALGDALAETAIYLLPGYLAGLAAGAGLAIHFIPAPAVAGTAMPLAIALRSVTVVTAVSAPDQADPALAEARIPRIDAPEQLA